ncbi:MAG: glycoside hydrolase family 3 N-terminal domain-containing protein [Marmoricola sp.]
MSTDRERTETAEDIRSWVSAAGSLAGGELLVAVDQEPWGIRRLHGLVPDCQPPADASTASLERFESAARSLAEVARSLGVSVFLSPVLDVLRGGNPWLEGRTLPSSLSPEDVGRIGAAYIRGTQAAGIATIAKHFPGFPAVSVDPAHDASAAVAAGTWGEGALTPFREAVVAGSTGIMLGPAVVPEVDRDEPASTSGPTVSLLRGALGFQGMIVSDDLDAPATLLGRDLYSTAVASLRAGADLVLLNGGDHLLGLADEVAELAAVDTVFARRLADAANRVRRVAEQYGAMRAQV